MFSRRSLWMGAVMAAVAGGLLGGVGISAPVLLFRTPDLGFNAYNGLLDDLSMMASVGMVLTTASLGGLYLLVRGGWMRLLGVFIAGFSCAALLVLLVDQSLGYPWTQSYFMLPEPSLPAQVLYAVAYWGRLLGIFVLGAVALWSGVLGWWRYLPLAIGLLETPAILVPLFSVLRPILPEDASESVAPLLVVGVPGLRPGLLGSVLWILLGYAMLRRGRLSERRMEENATRVEEQNNLAQTRRLYEEAWETGDLSVVDEIAAEDFFDHQHNRHGPEGLKRSITQLRTSFPDLRLVLEKQTAHDRKVVTRITFSGTDTGGVLWYPPTGRSVSFGAEYTDLFDSGSLMEHRGATDTDGLLEKLGLPPARSAPDRQGNP